MNRIFSLGFISLLFTQLTVAQNVSTQSLIRRYSHLAQKTFSVRNYSKSIYYHEKLDSLMPGLPEVHYNLGVCYLNSNYKYKALPYLEYAKQKKIENKQLNYFLAQAYHHNHQFDKAKSTFKEYLTVIKEDTAYDKPTTQEVMRRIAMCDNAKELISDSLLVEIENIGPQINTEFDEYVPVVSADQNTMYFTSRRPNKHNTKLSADGSYFEDVYIAHKDSLGKWLMAKDAPDPINSPEHDACIGMTPDAQTLFIYRLKSTDQSKGSIYFSKLAGEIWSKPAKLGSHVNTKKGWEASVSISEDNHKLYFSSDRPGGLGGLDIYVCELQPNNEWGEPKNLGPNVNTPYDEDCPFIHLDKKTLFFSSTGHNSMGGSDVFSTVYHADSATWSKPRNIGYPINSTDDDMYFVYSADGSKGYMSTALRKDAFGERDIYVVNRPKHSKSMIVLNGKILDEETNNPVEAYITVTNLQTNEVEGVYNSNSHTGKYVLALDFKKNYSIQFEATNFLFHSENVLVDDNEAIFQEQRNFKMKRIKSGNSLVLNNVFFDSNKQDLKDESLPELDKLLDFMKKHPHVYIEISGHTDSIGAAPYNLTLSQKRANSVRNYLVARKIPEKNVRIVGYGESRPVASNKTEDGRKLNRRTECLIYDMDALSKEHLEHLAKVDTLESDDLVVGEVLPHKKVGETLQCKVHFLYNNGAFLSEFSKQQLDKAAVALKRMPKMKLELHGYTDKVGNEYNNKLLYEKRVHTVLHYFMEKGFGPERFIIVPFHPAASEKLTDLSMGDVELRKVQLVLAEY